MATAPLLTEGTVALVTGAGSGIGRAIAVALAERGLKVVCVGRRREKLEETVAGCKGRALALQLDVTDAAAAATIEQRLPEACREVSILVNNAGHDIGGRKRFDQGRMEDWAAIVDANVLGTFRLCHALLPGMLARGRGHVVNLGSVVALRPYAGGTAYAASKYAVHGLTDTLRLDYRDSDIRFTEIMPGLTRTDFAASRVGGDRTKGEAYYDAAPQTMKPEDIARAVIFALEQPPHVTIAQLLVLPTREP